MSKATPESAPSPYLAARREWEEQYGGYVESARLWKIFGFIALVVASVAVVGAVYISSTKEIRAYVVETNGEGVINAVKPIDTPTDSKLVGKIVAKQLTSFIKASRNVVIDAAIARDNALEAYAYIEKGTPAATKLNNHFQSNDPFQRAVSETVYIEITGILPLKEGSYQLTWKEKIMDRKSGELVRPVETWTAVCFTELKAPKDEKTIIRNPTGLVIKDYNWSKEL